jgi:transcriptional regulator with XRE-family HTH domain
MPLDPMPDWVPTRRRQIGERIRSRRLQLHLSQIRLGELVGRDHKTVHRWETAITPPDLTDLLLLAHALDVPLRDLVDVV